MKKLLGILLVLASAKSFALNSIPLNSDILEIRSDETFDYPNYFRVHHDSSTTTIDLLNFDTINETFPKPTIPYNRATQYGPWLTDHKDGNCLNTRSKVLQRDSSTPVTFTASGCTVQSGEWNEPYTGRLHTSAADIQIDHVVALKNSYMTGGHEWTQAKRCLYANYMGNNFHLLSVDGPENLHKGDVTPSQYIPPNKAFTCEYIKIKPYLFTLFLWPANISCANNIIPVACEYFMCEYSLKNVF